MTVSIVSRTQEVVAVVDVPYSFTDKDSGQQKSGVTRKCAFIEFDGDSSAIVGLFVSKCSPDFTCNLKQRGVLQFDRYGRVSYLKPLSGDD